MFDVPESIGMENLERIAKVMQEAIPISIGMKSDIEVGRKWDQKMHKADVEEIRRKLLDGDEDSKEDEEDGDED